MSQIPPFRQRPNLHLALTQLSGSPRHPSQLISGSTPVSSPVPTPGGTPFATTAYSPLRSAGLKIPTPYSSTPSFPARRFSISPHGDHLWFHVRRLLSSKPIWLTLLVAALTLWWFNGLSDEVDVVKLNAAGLGKELLQERRMQDYQFYPATNPKIHYIGRWTATPNRLRKDGTFSGRAPRIQFHFMQFLIDFAPGVYFDVIVKNTTSFFVALHNAPLHSTAATSLTPAVPSASVNPGHLSFRPFSANEKPAAPVSLLAQIDDEEYVLLPNSSSLVSVCLNSLSPTQEHHIRIIAPMTDHYGCGVVELEGLWLSKGGSLNKVPGSMLSEDYVDEDLLGAENHIVGKKHRAGLNDFKKDGLNRFSHSHLHYGHGEDVLNANEERRKILEVITDSPGSFTSKEKSKRGSGTDALLAGVTGWEYLLGEMFGADHIAIGADGMCLTQECIGGTGFPAGIGDVFFRSGPYGSRYFEHSWAFTGYIPDVLASIHRHVVTGLPAPNTLQVLNLGDSDSLSFSEHALEYNKSMKDLINKFENTYISLVKGIRRLGYPVHPAIVQSERLGSPGVIPSGTPASIPIFIMRPLRGQLEQATQNIVAKLRFEGDKSVFWLDTSGWLDPADDSEDSMDFFLDDTVQPPKWRLSDQGNQRVAIFLHTHVCRYLAALKDKCAFLPQEVYQGTVYDPEEAQLDRFVEREKERKLRELFWNAEDDR